MLSEEWKNILKLTLEKISAANGRGEAKVVQMNEMRNQGKKRVKERFQNGTEV